MRFSIRDLLWATALVAMGLGWWVDRVESEVQRQDLREAFWEQGQVLLRAYEKGYVDEMQVEISKP